MLATSNQLQSAIRDLEEFKRASEQDRIISIERAVASAKNEMNEEIERIKEEKIKLEVQLQLLNGDGNIGAKRPAASPKNR